MGFLTKLYLTPGEKHALSLLCKRAQNPVESCTSVDGELRIEWNFGDATEEQNKLYIEMVGTLLRDLTERIAEQFPLELVKLLVSSNDFDEDGVYRKGGRLAMFKSNKKPNDTQGCLPCAFRVFIERLSPWHDRERKFLMLFKYI